MKSTGNGGSRMCLAVGGMPAPYLATWWGSPFTASTLPEVSFLSMSVTRGVKVSVLGWLVLLPCSSPLLPPSLCLGPSSCRCARSLAVLVGSDMSLEKGREGTLLPLGFLGRSHICWERCSVFCTLRKFQKAAFLFPHILARGHCWGSLPPTPVLFCKCSIVYIGAFHS